MQQHPGGKVLHILGMKQGDAGKLMHGKNQAPGELWVKKKKDTYISTLLFHHNSEFFPPIGFFIFRGLLTDRTVTVCYRKQSWHDR